MIGLIIGCCKGDYTRPRLWWKYLNRLLGKHKQMQKQAINSMLRISAEGTANAIAVQQISEKSRINDQN